MAKGASHATRPTSNTIRSRRPSGITLAGIFILAILVAGAAVSGVLQAGGASTEPLPPRLATEQAHQQQLAATARAYNSTHTMVPGSAPTFGPTPTFQTGIFNTGAMPGHFGFDVQNAYSGPAGSHWYTVYAGCKIDSTAPDSLGDGGVFVFQDDGATVNLGSFIAPGHLSCLKAVSYSGVMLQLQSNTGQTITFDLLTRTFMQ